MRSKQTKYPQLYKKKLEEFFLMESGKGYIQQIAEMAGVHYDTARKWFRTNRKNSAVERAAFELKLKIENELKIKEKKAE